jgi:hypothetical protein
MSQLSILAEHFVKVKEVSTITFAPTQVKLLQLVTSGYHFYQCLESRVC